MDKINLGLKLVKDFENELKAKGLSKYYYINLVSDIKILDRKIKQLKGLIDDKNSMINKALSKINYLEKLELRISKINSIKIEINGMENELNELDKFIEILSDSLEIKKIRENMSIEDFQQQYKNKEKLLSDLEIWLQVNKNEETVSKYKLELSQLNVQMDQATKAIEKINKELLLYETKIKNLNKRIEYKEESQIEQFIYDIQNHILNSEHNDSECPVCGTDFKLNPKSLKEHVKEKFNKSKEDLNGLHQKKLELVKNYNDLKNEYDVNVKILDETNKNIQGLEERIEKLNTQNINLRSNIKEYLNNDGLITNEANIRKIKNYLDKYKSIYNEISIILNKISQRKVLIQEIENKKLEVEKEIDNIPPRYSLYLESNIKLANRKKLLREYVDLTRGEIGNFEEQLDTNLFEYEEFLKRERGLINISQKIQKGFNDNYCILDSQNMLREIQEKHANFNYIIQQLESIIYSIYSFLNQNEFSRLKSKREQISNELIKMNKRIEKTKAILEYIEEFIKGHKNIQTSLLNQYLDDQSKNINFYFKQISPHAFYKNVKLVAMKGELYILLFEEGEEIPSYEYEILKNEVNASLTFSAAQSTILALSIFLSLNSTHNWSNLKVLGIDDPFQNLDDVNIFSFIDVISSLINQKQKQVLLSTHSNDFPKLISSKIDLKDNEIGYITFLSYSQEKMLISSNVHSSSEM